MARGKLKLELIADEKLRCRTFRNRQKGLKKKLHELSTLCDVEACMIMYCDQNGNGTYSSQPDVWPENHYEVQRIVNKYISERKEDHGKRTVDLSDILESRKREAELELQKLQEKNGKTKGQTSETGLELDGLSYEKLMEINDKLDMKLEHVKSLIDFKKGEAGSHIPGLPTAQGTEMLDFPDTSDLTVQEILFRLAPQCIPAMNLPNWLLCNSVYELDSSACDLVPNILPIDPLLASNHLGHYAGNFWPEDSTCISWLDKQPAGSVIYVDFGSLAILSQHQFNELALGIELVGRPFLWVVPSDFTNGSAAEYSDGFIERVAEHGKIVSWAPQEKVLAHPSVACFLSHCGCNSTIDGTGMGVPFLCWPYFADQFHNQSYICDKWKVGLGLNRDENGFISRHEIKKKIEMLVSDDGIKANAEKLKEMARKSVSEGGSSYENFKTFIEAMKY